MTHSQSPLGHRRGGILLHPTSLPDAPGNGDLGPAAYHFVDFLADAGLSVWQTLPLGPTHEDGSPYQCLSVHAGNPDLISPQWLVERGWLGDAPRLEGASAEDWRAQSVRRALERLAVSDAQAVQAFDAFKAERAGWLEDYALYRVLRARFEGRGWTGWPDALRDREPAALRNAREALTDELELVRFEQFVFFEQWKALRRYAAQRRVLLFGDMPIFVAHDSAEVWAHREYFTLGEDGQPRVVAGVPPDYFSETGQRWGNPHYDWARMRADDFDWWVRRMRTQLELFDWVRIDHFRGFEAYWSIPADAETAVEGHWVKAPGAELLDALYRAFDALPVIAEDLGTITPEVNALLERFGLPGMKVLQFAFGGGPDNPYLPHNHEVNGVVYTGTHDNDTTLGWYESAGAAEREHVQAYFGPTEEPVPWLLIRAALASVARVAMVPLQDVLALNSAHRMNTPGTQEGNWRWRFSWEQVPADLAARLRAMMHLYGRHPQDPEPE